MLAEKQSLERELAAKSAASIKNLIKSPFSPLTTSAAGTPRLAAAMRWIEDTIATPIRSPFADLKQTSDAPEVEAETVVPASATKRAVSVGKSRLRLGASPLPKTPGAACEDSAEGGRVTTPTVRASAVRRLYRSLSPSLSLSSHR